jgi:hypothetical protein
MKLQACYTVLLETLAGATRAHLVGPDGSTVGTYVQATAEDAVNSACISLEVLGAREAAAAIRRNWKAQQEGGS